MRTALLLLLLAGCAAPPVVPPPRDRAAELVELLAADDLEMREAAGRELVAMGAAAEAAVRRRLEQAPDPDLRSRLASALERIEVALFDKLPESGELGAVSVSLMHAFAWTRDGGTFVSTVWRLHNAGAEPATLRIARAWIVAGGTIEDAQPHGTKLDPDPVYELAPGRVWKPAIKMPKGQASAPGSEAWAVLDFVDDSGRRLRLRTTPVPVEKGN